MMRWPYTIGQGHGKNSAACIEDCEAKQKNVLTRELKRARFEVEECRFIDRKEDFPEELLLDGRESVGAVAVKPLIK